eukprot:jgi/Mesen1/8024/ME000426S07165
MALRLYTHGSTIAAAAAAAAVATAAASGDLSDKLTNTVHPVVLHHASHSPTQSVPPSRLLQKDIDSTRNSYHQGLLLCTPLDASISYSTFPTTSFRALYDHQRIHAEVSTSYQAASSVLPCHIRNPEAWTSLQTSSPFTVSSSSSFLVPHQIDLPSLSQLEKAGSLQPRVRCKAKVVEAILSGGTPAGGGGSSRAGLRGPFGLNSAAGRGAGQPGSDHSSLHTWHLPSPASSISGKPTAVGDGASPSKEGEGPVVTVVLLGWLGAKQRHLRKYAEWYNAQGIHAVTFVVPMGDVLSLNPGGKAEGHVDMLVEELDRWLHATATTQATASAEQEHGQIPGKERERERQLIFHTFSNTGWLTYGAVLKRLKEHHGDAVHDHIRGCVVDSAPVVDPDPQVWASGFSAAILKKRSVAAAGGARAGGGGGDMRADAAKAGAADIEGALPRAQPDAVERALLGILERFFSVFLRLPAIRSKLLEVTKVLSDEQPPCPQLYIYSTADCVIPAANVEAFIKSQKRGGRTVMSRRLEDSPHVDHFRTFPELYTGQLRKFLKQCLPLWQPSSPAAAPAPAADA